MLLHLLMTLMLGVPLWAQTIVDVAQGDATLTTLVAALTQAELLTVLSGAGPFTVFAPTNTAFGNVDATTLGRLLTDPYKEQLKDLLLHHAASGQVASSSLTVGQVIPTLQSPADNLTVSSVSPTVVVSGATVSTPDIAASNGVVHKVDSVILAASTQRTIVDIATGSDQFSTLVTALTQAQLVSTLRGTAGGPFTVFAPVNSAFAALDSWILPRLLQPVFLPQLQNLLQYHVIANTTTVSSSLTDGLTVNMLNGEAVNVSTPSAVRINTATVTAADNLANNGVVHAIDAVLVPAFLGRTVVDVATGSNEFTTLVELLTSADLAATLQGEGPFTVFAPTNSAFAKLDSSLLATLREPAARDQLVNILRYHVVSENLVASNLTAGNLETLNSQTVAVSVDPLRINSATVTSSSLCNNGVVHAIDAVLLPASTSSGAASKCSITAVLVYAAVLIMFN